MRPAGREVLAGQSAEQSPEQQSAQQGLEGSGGGGGGAGRHAGQRDEATGVWLVSKDDEGDWVGKLVRGLWPYARDAVREYAWQTIPGQLEASRPDFVSAVCGGAQAFQPWSRRCQGNRQRQRWERGAAVGSGRSRLRRV